MAKTKSDGSRTLPKKRNPLLKASETPDYNVLVDKRRLGRTELSVKSAQVGTTSATSPENLGTIEYAYLGAPLPDELAGSEIFPPVANVQLPEEYFMMRRSKDGYVSATGMFKVAFPWAKQSEERAERDYLQTLATTSADEQAGNIWINEEAALVLAEEYGILPWIRALLDPALPTTEPARAKGEAISAPPKFEFKAGGSGSPLGPPLSPARPKKTKKSASPTKSSSKDSASPRKRATKAEKDARAKAAKAASETLQTALESAASVADSESVAGTEVEVPKINGTATPASPKPRKKTEKKKKAANVSTDDKVTVQVDSTVEAKGDVKRTHTNVRVQMPADSPELPLPESTEEMIAKAKDMVKEATKLEGQNGTASSSKKSKRKAEHIEAEDDELSVEAAAAKAAGQALQPAKKARLMEQEARSQKVRSRALMGLAATLTIGAIAPYFLG